MRIQTSALIAGTIFGLGLGISGMANPDKVINFLNILGHWDPSLIFVLGGGVLVTFLGFRLIFTRERPLLDDDFFVPTNKIIDKKLIIGSSMFGAGWGMTGFCPGPAISGLAFGVIEPVIFVASMLVGYLFIEKVVNKKVTKN